jgi:SAM-dependent methyltransferase
MESIRSRFLAYLPTGCRILDFGCGTGRDTKAFQELGYDVTAIDGSEALCGIARSLTSLPVRCLDFRNYKPEEGEIYEGIWACASLLHLQKNELLPVMKVLSQAMILGGAFYVSFKYGNFEGERNGRHFTDFTLEEFREFIKSIPELSVAEYWVTGDVRPGRGDERWLNIVLQRTMTCK